MQKKALVYMEYGSPLFYLPFNFTSRGTPCSNEKARYSVTSSARRVRILNSVGEGNIGVYQPLRPKDRTNHKWSGKQNVRRSVG
jgi:hypothetical protein